MLAVAGIPQTTLLLALVYSLLALHTARRLVWLEANATRSDIKVNTKKLFVVACLVVTVLRVVSFTSITLLNSHNFTLDAGDDSATSLSDKIEMVLFDLPDFFCVSAYVLLLVVWAEAYLKSRQHWLSTASFRHYWMLGYVIFNVNLYAVQVALYSMMFVSSVDPAYLSVWIYAVLTAINLCLPLIWAAGYVYLSFVFSGFPLSSNASKLRLSTLSRVGTVWTLSRLGWGLVTLSSALRGWLSILGDRHPLLYSFALVALFSLAEVLPIVVSLQEATIQSLAAAARSQSVSFAPGQSILGSCKDSADDHRTASGGAWGSYEAVTVRSDTASEHALSIDTESGARRPESKAQFSPLARTLGATFPVPDPAYATPTQPSGRKHLLRVEPSPAPPSALATTRVTPNRGLVVTAAVRNTPSPLAALHYLQGRHLVGRPLSGAVSSRQGPGAPSRGAASINADEEDEWSGDEEVGGSGRSAGSLSSSARLPHREGSTLLPGSGEGGGLLAWLRGI